ncbi:ABC transporter ATP-binding protein [Rhodospirillaceae bacterium SYSU D60014]|uniref:ABC transporter ATP-binding protein n=1 Tax=Virgifigura deserti TaxID=2268457 RepID=UPI000E65F5F2
MRDKEAYLQSPSRFLARYVRGRAAAFGGLLALVVGASACAVIVQYCMKLLVDSMAAPERDMSAVWGALGLFIGLIATENILWRFSGWLACRTTIGVGVDTRLDLFEYLSGHPMRYFTGQFAGSLGSRITATAGNIGALTNTFVWNIVPPCTDFIGAVIIFTTVDWRMAAALTGFVALLAGGLVLLGIRGRPLHQAYAERANIVGGELVDVIANVWAVKAFSARVRERERLAHKFGFEALSQRRSWMYLEKIRVLHDLALWVMASAMLIWAIRLWSSGDITPGDVVVVSALTFRILHGSRDLALALIGTAQQFGFIAETLRIIGQPHEVADNPGAGQIVNRGGSIDFEHVRFGYRRDQPVFDDFTLHIPAGQKIGIVGSSGAGKSTMAGLLQRLYDVQSGRILIDGQPLTNITQDSLRAMIAVVPQEVSLFHRSIKENIRYARPTASDGEVIAAARAAQCEEFIQNLPDGYETLVGERGLELSGGQRQRVGIARALLKDAPIIILDEATSALDSELEMEVQRACAEALGDRTVIAIAHRLSTLTAFERVIVLVDGRVVEDGSPWELRRRSGVFEKLWRMQVDDVSLDSARRTGTGTLRV